MFRFAIAFYKKIFNTQDKKRLFSNFVSLSVLRGANYILPLITLPYLVRVLGPEKFGLIAFAQAFIQYFNILTDYGFNLSATREISIHRENKEKVAEIFSSVMVIKIFLLLLSFIIMLVIVFSFQKFRENCLIYFFAFGMVIGQALFPIWLFQGTEKMEYITLLNILAKLIFTISIFIFIKQSSHYILVPLINSLGFIVAAIGALWIVFKNFDIVFKIPKIEALKHELIEGWYIFISTFAISLYTISNTFILGLFTNNTTVGYYAGAEKIITAAKGLFNPISQSIYPYINNIASKSKEHAILFIKKITYLIGGISLGLSFFIFSFSDLIVKILLGNQYRESTTILRILAFLPFIVGLSNILGVQTMLTFGYKKVFSKILISAALTNIFLAFILTPLYSYIGISLAVLISEIFITISMFIYLQKKGIKVLEGKIV